MKHELMKQALLQTQHNQYKIIVYSFKFIYSSVIATYQNNDESQKFTYLPGLRDPELDPTR